MIGTYKIPPDKINEMKGAFLSSIIKFIVIIYIFFVVILIVRSEPDMLSSLLMVTGMFAGLLLLFLLINTFHHRPLYNSIIQLTENESSEVEKICLPYDYVMRKLEPSLLRT
jgi:hypothetical protein